MTRKTVGKYEWIELGKHLVQRVKGYFPVHCGPIPHFQRWVVVCKEMYDKVIH